MEWISLGKETDVVALNAVDQITYTISVPKDAPTGEGHATIIVRNETGQAESGNSNVAIESTYPFATVIFAEITGESRKQNAAAENNVPIISFRIPLTVSSMVRNDGNVHTDAKYTLQV